METYSVSQGILYLVVPFATSHLKQTRPPWLGHDTQSSRSLPEQTQNCRWDARSLLAWALHPRGQWRQCCKLNLTNPNLPCYLGRVDEGLNE